MKKDQPMVRCITAPNGGKMTGSGTNTYLIGEESLAVIDPGPVIDSHIEAILEAGAGKIRWVLATHTHPDHSPGGAILARETGARLIGCPMSDDGMQDASFRVDRKLSHGDKLDTEEFCLEAIHTPGHVGNHFCYFLHETGTIFTGDHIMQGSTVVIVPPSGNMSDYLNSLSRLLEYPVEVLAPGHGDLMDNPREVIDFLINHRLNRERLVLEALTEMGESSLEALLPVVYSDTDPFLFKAARYSLWAHLLKLEKDGRIIKTIENHWLFGEEHWRLL